MPNERIFFVTNRKVVSEAPGNSDFGGAYQDHPEQLRVGEATVQCPAGYASADPPAPSAITVYPENQQVVPKILGSVKLFDELMAILRSGGKRDLVFYVHGYDTAFKDGLSCAAQLQHNINMVRFNLIAGDPALAEQLPLVQVVIFSWPSEGSLVPEVAYFDDRGQASLSGLAFARAVQIAKAKLDSLQRDRVIAAGIRGNPASTPLGGRSGAFDPRTVCNFNVHLMVQSMGNYLVRCAVQRLRRQPEFQPRFAQVFDQIFMTGADEDRDAFANIDKLQLLPDLGRQLTLYVNHKDRALLVSETTKHLSGRLGREGPEHDVNLTKVSTADVAPVLPQSASDYTHHYYGRLDPVVQMDFLYCMAGRTLDRIPDRVLVTQPRQFRLQAPGGAEATRATG